MLFACPHEVGDMVYINLNLKIALIDLLFITVLVGFSFPFFSTYLSYNIAQFHNIASSKKYIQHTFGTILEASMIQFPQVFFLHIDIVEYK